MTTAAQPSNEYSFIVGKPDIIRLEEGKIAFGSSMSANVVAWSSKDANDLLYSICWNDIVLYPTKQLADEELAGKPIVIVPQVGAMMMWPVDWDHDGQDDLIATKRSGDIYFIKIAGKYPKLACDKPVNICDAKSGHPFNIPYSNPNHPVLDNLGGYIDNDFFNYVYPVVYPRNDKPTFFDRLLGCLGRNKKSTHVDLILGDWGGNLWWLKDVSDGKTIPQYTGTTYSKTNGNQYAKPSALIRDENGNPYLLGDNVDSGTKYAGGNTRPYVYFNSATRQYDLMVLAQGKNEIYYLKRIGTSPDGSPQFKNLGPVKFSDKVSEQEGRRAGSWFAFLFFYGQETDKNMAICVGGNIAMFENTKAKSEVPEFKFSHWVRGKDVVAPFSGLAGILIDKATNKRYALSALCCREILNTDRGLRLTGKTIGFYDQHGGFSVEGETDPQGGKSWGFHRNSKWDFDNSGKQHLIVGTDKGLLFLLIEDQPLCLKEKAVFKSIGPLKDTAGNVIKVHNRATAEAIDLNGDGKEDLVVGGITYQLGTKTDPTPGGGLYYFINKGLDKDGTPILEPKQPVKMNGYVMKFPQVNSHIALQAVDLDGDGVKELVVSSSRASKVYKASKNVGEIDYISDMPLMSLTDQLIDIDGDGKLEWISGDNETGVGYIQRLTITESKQTSKPRTP